MTAPADLACVACGPAGKDFTQVTRNDGGRAYWRCRGCATIHLFPLPAVESNEAFESESIAREMAATDDMRIGYLRKRFALLEKPATVTGNPRLLDVGCSTGRLMGLARNAGWHVTGIEMSPALAREARSYLGDGVCVIEGDVMNVDPTDQVPFDAIVALDVIEHVLEPEAFLRKLYTMLNPNGQLLLHTPNASSLRAKLQRQNWNMLIPEYHFHLFSGAGIAKLLRQTGFRVEVQASASGTGTETATAALLAPLKETMLNALFFGNAQVILARKP